MVGSHWLGNGADPSAYSPLQPLALPSEPQRIAQAAVVNGFVASILAAEPAANVVVLGDLNDYQLSAPLLALKGTILSDPIETLPENQRYTCICSGNGQALDVLPTASVPTVDGVPTTATVSGGGPGCTFTSAAWVLLSSVPEPPPAGKVFPFGLFDFSVAGCTPGATLTFSLTVPGALGDDVVGVQDGAVVDQGGPAVDPSTSAIPALDPRGLAVLAALLGAGGALLLASRRP